MNCFIRVYPRSRRRGDQTGVAALVMVPGERRSLPYGALQFFTLGDCDSLNEALLTLYDVAAGEGLKVTRLLAGEGWPS